jgi:hypothetical protein
MGIRKILEAICDYCGAAISHDYDLTKPQMKKNIIRYGAVVQKDKTFCDQECCSKWWTAKTSGQLEVAR